MHVQVCLAVMVAGAASVGGLTAHAAERPANLVTVAFQPKDEAKAPAADAKAPDAKAPDAKAGPAVSDDPAVAAFKTKLADWKQLLVDARLKQFEFKAAKPADQKAIEEKFKEIVARGLGMQGDLQSAAEAAYIAAPNKDEEVSAFMTSAIATAMGKDDYAESLRLANLLIDNNFHKKAIYTVAGVSAFNIGDLETAEKNLKLAQEAKVIDRDGQAYLDLIPTYKEKWAKEQELRAAEAKADDLPRVVLKTSKGDIVVELFENEAPNTVANFISLVQRGFYNGSDFHRVIRGFMAQGGSPKGEEDGGPGYTIADECRQENHRLHFRGALSMAKKPEPDTGGSQFFLTFKPTPHLDGMHTVFGRVVDGEKALAELTRHEPGKKGQTPADTIIEAKVVRKRNHAYQPKTISDKDEKAAATDKAPPAKSTDEKAPPAKK